MANPGVALSSKIYVAGHRGLVGAAMVRALRSRGYWNLVMRPRSELDLRDFRAVLSFFRQERPECVYLAAARVGGILANTKFPVEFISDNVLITVNVLAAAHQAGVKKLLFLGSSCMYPRLAPQPMREEVLLTGPLEPTNQGYALTKIVGTELVAAYRRQYGDNFISAIPSNVYGPGDKFDPENSHVVGALIRRAHDAKVSGASFVEVWGTGKARREFLHVDDLADACLFLMDCYDEPIPINVGTGEDIAVGDLARLICEVVGFGGNLQFDPSKPDGMPRKLVDTSRINRLGWRARIPLREGLAETYRWFLEHRCGI